MEMFRKPKQRNLRGRTDLDTSEDDLSATTHSSTQDRPTTITIPVTKKIEPIKPKALLSFGDDEGDTEEFKVNKTRESRKMTKEVKKQLKQATNEQKTTPTIEEQPMSINKEENNNNSNSNTGEIEIKCKFLLAFFSHCEREFIGF